MPGMDAFGFKWLWCTDDLIYCGMVDVFAYLPWVIWCSFKTNACFSLTQTHFCHVSFFPDVAFGSFCWAMVVQWFLSIGFVYFSTRGTISQDTEARRPVKTLFQVKTIFIVLCQLWLIFVGYLFYSDEFHNINMKQTLMVAFAFQSVTSIFQLALWWTILDSGNNSLKSKAKNEAPRSAFLLLSTPLSTAYIWKFRLVTVCTWILSFSKSMKDAIISVSGIITYIPRELDVVFTDLAVGVMLLRQKHLKYFRKEDLMRNSRPPIILADGSPADQFPTTDMPTWMNLHLAKRYFLTSSGVFPLPWILYRNMSCKLKRAWTHLTKGVLVAKDDCCRSNASGAGLNYKLPYKDLIHLSFRNKVYYIPFCVTADTNASSVVITVRGTMPSSDILTELPSTMENDSIHDISCHAEILKAAQRIHDILKNNSILKEAFKKREGCQLVTTGHGLGASIAGVLALLLRPFNPSVKCFAFEPLPCVRSRTAETTFDVIFSIVFDNKFIPYLSFKDIEDMMKEIVKSAEGCNLPKYKLIFWSLPCDYDDLAAQENEALSTTIFSKTEPSPIELECAGADEKRNVNENNILRQPHTARMFLPGRILHIRFHKNRYYLQILTAKDFHKPMILPGMITHHSEQYIDRCLEQLGQTNTISSANL